MAMFLKGMSKERFEQRLFRIFAQAGYSPVRILTVTPEEMVEIRQTFIGVAGVLSAPLVEDAVPVDGFSGSVEAEESLLQAVSERTNTRISRRENSLFILFTFLFNIY